MENWRRCYWKCNVQIASIKHKLNEKVSLELRGEIILVNEFERINSENESLGKETLAKWQKYSIELLDN